MATPKHITDAVLIGTGEFSIAVGASTPAAAQLIGYKDFGNVKVFDVSAEGEKKEHYGSYRGTQVRDRLDNRKLKIGYKLTCDEWTADMLSYFFFGKQNGSLTRSALAAAAGTAQAFAAGTPSDVNKWYDILDASGVRHRFLTGVTFASKTEGTDFELDLTLGRVRWLTVQTASVTPTITAPAIVAGDNNNLAIVDPLTQGLIQGMCRLVCFDELSRQNIVFDHVDFYGQLALDGSPSIKGDDYSDYSIMVNVGTPRGKIFVRNYP